MYPLQLFCFRQMIRFINKLVLMPNDNIARCVLIEMAWDVKNWTVENWLSCVLEFANKIGVPLQLGDGDDIIPLISEAQCMTAVRRFYHRLFTKPDARSEMRRYHSNFGGGLPCRGGKWRAADYTLLPLSSKKSTMLARLRLGSHYLKCVTGAWQKPQPLPYHERICDSCGAGAVQDEYHLIFECQHFADKRHGLQPYFDNLAGRLSLWAIVNDRYAQIPLADFLASTGLMVK